MSNTKRTCFHNVLSLLSFGSLCPIAAGRAISWCTFIPPFRRRYTCNRQPVPIWLWDIEASTFYKEICSQMEARLSPLISGRFSNLKHVKHFIACIFDGLRLFRYSFWDQSVVWEFAAVTKVMILCFGLWHHALDKWQWAFSMTSTVFEI
jgi:hypothetical protein